jgi:hypothetical protein
MQAYGVLRHSVKRTLSEKFALTETAGYSAWKWVNMKKDQRRRLLSPRSDFHPFFGASHYKQLGLKWDDKSDENRRVKRTDCLQQI